MSDHLMSTYARQAVAFSHGEGAWLWDDAGKQYLDAISGVAVCALGHAHPAVTEAICKQAGKLIHTSNLYRISLQEELADQLARISTLDKAFLCNSGAEAIEACIKIARLYGHRKQIDRPAIIVMDNSFHGRTMATLSASGNRKVQAGFEPLVSGFIRAPFNDIEALRTIVRNSPDAVAILLEPIQGESGINLADDDYLAEVRSLCDENGLLMMLDEIQSGLCRTGQWFAWQHHDARPDVMAIAKSLGNGVPIGACLARDEAANLFQPGNHGSTFGGNPLACSAALAVLQAMDEHQLATRATALGQRILAGLKDKLAGNASVKEIRGKGLMIGIELTSACTELVGMGLDHGILFTVQADRVVRLLPPLIISADEADQIVDRVSTVINTRNQ